MITQNSFDFRMKMEVRDYECDMQGIVNNAVYQNYMEHTRHQFIKTIGLNFTDLCVRGIDMVVARIEIAFKNSLQSNDCFISCLNVRKEGIKYVFDQAIFHADTQKLVAMGTITSVARINGKLTSVAFVDQAIENYKR